MHAILFLRPTVFFFPIPDLVLTLFLRIWYYRSERAAARRGVSVTFLEDADGKIVSIALRGDRSFDEIYQLRLALEEIGDFLESFLLRIKLPKNSHRKKKRKNTCYTWKFTAIFLVHNSQVTSENTGALIRPNWRFWFGRCIYCILFFPLSDSCLLNWRIWFFQCCIRRFYTFLTTREMPCATQKSCEVRLRMNSAKRLEWYTDFLYLWCVLL